MSRSLNGALIVGCLALLIVPCEGQARRGKSKQKGPKLSEIVDRVQTTYTELMGNSNPAVRRTVFEGQLELGKQDYKAAMARGIEEKDWAIQGPALKAAFKGRDRAAEEEGEGDSNQVAGVRRC